MYQSRWTIKARVTAKSDIRTWSNAKGNGKLFNVDLLDAEGGQIRASAFNDAAEKFFALMNIGSVYTISKGSLKIANKKFNRLPNEYELHLNSDAVVEPCPDDDSSIQDQVFEFKTLEELNNMAPDSFCDVLGVVTALSAITNLTSKAGKDLTKRVIQVVDQSQLSIDVTMWGSEAESWNEEKIRPGSGQIVAIKNCKVSDFGGKSLNMSFGSQLIVNPQRPEAAALSEWWSTHQDKAFDNMSKKGGGGQRGNDPVKTLDEIKTEQLGYKANPDYFVTRATVTFIKHDNEKPPWYKACPSDSCNKMVKEDSEGWRCEKCNKSVASYTPRYIMSLLVCDATGSQWLNAFNEVAEVLLGKTAAEMEQIKKAGDEAGFEAVFQEGNFKTYNFKCKAKAETMQDQTRVRVNVMNAYSINWVTESRGLLAEIAKFQ